MMTVAHLMRPLPATEQITEALRRVQFLRNALTNAKNELADKRNDFAANNADLIDAIAADTAAVEQAEGAARALALAEFQMHGNKKPAPGVEIKMRSEVSYDDFEALTWARATGVAIKYTVDAKVLKAVLPNLEPDVQKRMKAVFTETPQAQLATDLDKVLAV